MKIVKANYSVAIEVGNHLMLFLVISSMIFQFWPEEFTGQSSKLNDEFVFTIQKTKWLNWCQ